MTNNHIRCLIVLIVTGLILVVVIGTIIYLVRRSEHRAINYDSCARPKQYATDYDFDYTTNTKEYRNINSSVDYFRLSLSWSPTFCSGKKDAENLFQCQHSFGFIVHGLWPSSFNKTNNSHPRNCRNEQAMPMEIIRKYFCIMPSENLMQAEWEKHGTCYWEKPEDYFEQINSLYSKIHLPNNINDILNNQTSVKNAIRKSIKQSFLNINPQLTYNYIDVMMNNKRKLKEVAFCYDRSFNHIKCFGNI
jgi:ribonuclease T2